MVRQDDIARSYIGVRQHERAEGKRNQTAGILRFRGYDRARGLVQLDSSSACARFRIRILPGVAYRLPEDDASF